MQQQFPIEDICFLPAARCWLKVLSRWAIGTGIAFVAITGPGES